MYYQDFMYEIEYRKDSSDPHVDYLSIIPVEIDIIKKGSCFEIEQRTRSTGNNYNFTRKSYK